MTGRLFWSRALVAVGLGLLPLVFVGCPATTASGLAPLELYALRYGLSIYPPSLLDATRRDVGRDFAWLFYFVRDGERRVLIDTGFTSRTYGRAFGVTDYIAPDVLAARAEIPAESVTDIVLTHLHPDHAGGLALFARARVHIQKREYEAALKGAAEREIQGALRAAYREGRLRLLSGDGPITERIRVLFSGGHTTGSQAVMIDDRFLITGDECYRSVDCARGSGIPSRLARRPAANREFASRAARMAREGIIILTMHDNEVFESYPEIAVGVRRIYPAR